eukprot:2369202-Pyramimonas_sp.AAC.1
MQEAQIPIKEHENLIEWDREANTSIIVGAAAENYTADQLKRNIQPIMDRCELSEVSGRWSGRAPRGASSFSSVRTPTHRLVRSGPSIASSKA